MISYKKTIVLCKTGGPIDYEKFSEVPQPLCSTYERPEKSIAIQMHKSRFAIQ